MNNGREEKILAALLATSTVRDASKKCGVPERTIHRRLADPNFRAEYQQRRSELVRVAWDGLRGSLEDATAVVRELMADPLAPPQTRLNAARTTLEFTLKATEQLDILTRLEALEAAQNGL